MPRRRKKSSQQRKPPLVFTESPVNIQTHVPTPVLCANHPPTAKAVPVYELEDMPWVSPQFRGAPLSDRRHRRQQVTRQRRRSLGSSLAAAGNTNKENNQWGSIAVVGNRKSKFKSLKFVGDQTTVASLSEEVNISCDTETTADEETEIQDEISDPETSCDDLHARKSKNAYCGRKGHHLDLNEITKGKHPPVGSSHNQHSDLYDDTRMKLSVSAVDSEDSATAAKLDSDTGNAIVQNAETIGTDGAHEIEPFIMHCDTKKRKRVRHRKTSKLKNVRKSVFNLSAISADSDSSYSPAHLGNKNSDTVFEGTQQRRSASMTSPVKMLFTKKHNSSCIIGTKGREIISPTDYSDSDNLATNKNLSSTESSYTQSPVRRSSRIAANLKHLVREGTPMEKRSKFMRVLVPDTPDSEKGWSIRQKQLKGII